MIGQVVGSYRITALLGEGGMGEVYAAEHQLIGRKAAIKVLRPEMSANAEIVQRFFNEARATALIRHPGIVDAFDFGHLPNGRAFIAMERLDGESLSKRIGRVGPMALSEIVAIGRQAASALAAAHEKGIVHRDLKPDNIFLCPDEHVPGGTRVKLLDFGIAKLALDGGQAAGGPKTRTGVIIGTPAYMSPEQCKSSGEVDCRSDIYSLGCVLYEMACGRPPFVKEGAGELLGAHIYEEPPRPRELNPRVNGALEAVILRALVKDPARRTPLVAELRRGLEEAGGILPSDASGESKAMPVRDSPPLDERSGRVYQSTTISMAAGETVHRARLPRAPALVAGGVVTILVAAGIAFLSSTPKAPNASVAGPIGAKPAQAPTSPVVVPPLEPPKTVPLQIDSEPSGASVIDPEDGHVLGLTPLRQTVARGEGDLIFVIRLTGYDDGHLSLSGQTGGAARVELHSVAAPRPEARPIEHSAPRKKKEKKDVGLFEN